ncbi:peptidase C14 caspase catalytic subunit p20 [Tolypothrix sp. NIES-4075]|uniref:nSTAND1 domain-containing NTPase n=1 Tax=Tolypothrix sp. NIES-4075 TaxID=2005459 RepID=UPI000B5C4632|nr:caspase family protein [Tolypothrix sp. NIES-4075]GAX44992.1 peptidase C14 caspase catalytic subunit p20 [Tolypothrix sp. NIES-4075]
MSPLGVATSRSTYALETGHAKIWLVLVGVNQYQDERLPSLRYSALDCQGLAEALADATQAFPQTEVWTHHDFSLQLPTLTNIRTTLKQIAAAAQPQDTILFYFSGHGMVESKSGQVVLCLADTQTNNLLNTGLGLQELLHLLGHSGAQTQLVLLDACHSGSMSLKGAKGEIPNRENLTPQMVDLLRQKAKKSKGFYALLSCDTDQQSWEFPELGHGVFTYYLMRGLRGEAADGRGLIEADGLYRYIYHQTQQYIEQTNQQLRLINQQKRGRGETRLYSEYPLQTPKRIVEGVGEIVLGLKSEVVESSSLRQALIVEGLTTNKTTLDFCKLLRGVGGFELEYLPQADKISASYIQEGMQNCLQKKQDSQSLEHDATVLLYLRGRLKQTEAGEAVLVVGSDIELSRSWLRQQLRRSPYTQQIIILDCLCEQTQQVSLQDWLEDLQLSSEQGQCIIAAASPSYNPEQFVQVLHDTLKAAQQQNSLSVASWITQLQLSCSNTLPLHIWVSGIRGVIEIIPTRTGIRDIKLTEAIDLGLCPYRGLRAFTPEDAQYFYGREALTQQLMHHLASKSFLAVVGASGSGKSSVVQAGLIAQLQRGKQLPGSEEWWIKSFRPGANPLLALSRRLVDSGTEKEKAYQQIQLEKILYQGRQGFAHWLSNRPEPTIILVIDQFEELFTLAQAGERQRFLELILGALELSEGKLKIVITLRADFIAPCLEIPKLAQVLQQSSILVPPCLSEEEYRHVIINPAEQVGLTVEPVLVEVLLRELHRSPGDLPLLEFVLEQLWEHRVAGKLTLQAYQQHLGGIKGALESKAQAVYDSLDPEAQECARWIFLSLTQLGEGTEDTRRRVYKSELIVKKYPAPLVEKTLAALTAAKLVVVNLEEGGRGRGGEGGKGDSLETPWRLLGDSLENNSFPPSPHPPLPPSSSVTIEVAHEVLIRYWSTLRCWLEENRGRLRSQRQIEQAAQLWKHGGEQSDFLLQGVRLAEAEDIYINYTEELSFDVQRFIAACLEERQRQQLQEKRRLKQAQKAVTVISILGITAFSFAGLAYQQSQKAQLREIQTLNSLSENFLFSHKQLEALSTSVKAGQELQRMMFSSQVMYPDITKQIKTATATTLQQAIDQTQERNRLIGHNSWVSSVSFSPDGQMLASASTDTTIKLWNRHGKLLHTLRGHSDGVNSVSFSPDGQIIASAGTDATIKLWSRDGKLLKTLSGHNDGVNSVAFSPDGQMIVSGSDDDSIKLWSRDGKLLKTLTGHSLGVNSVTFSPKGDIIASGSDDRTIKLWSLDGRLLKTLSGHTDEVLSVAWSKDGQTIASASADNTVKLWSRDGRLLNTLTGHNSDVKSVSFSPNGKIIASASTDKTIKLWSLDGQLLGTLQGHNHVVSSVSFSSDGQLLASASDDYTIRLWNLDINAPKTLFGHKDSVNSAWFNPQGNTVFSVSNDKTMKFWSLDGKLLKSISSPINDITSISFTSDENTVATASADNTIQLRKRDGTLLHILKGHTDWIINMSFSPDAKILASASTDKTVKLWSIDGRLLNTLKGHNAWVTNVEFSPDGELLASASADNTIKLWSRDGRLLKTLNGHNASVWALTFSPDGKIIASGSQDGTVKLWSRDGRLLQNLTGHTDAVNNLSFSPDGKMIASASDDDTIKLWSVHSGMLLRTFQGHTGDVRSVNFSPDGKMIVSASQDKTVKIWQLTGIELQTLNLSQLLKRGCDRLHDYLTTNPNLNTGDRNICQ